MTMKRILLCTDFSASSEDAIAYALSLARALFAEVLLFHAVELPAGLDAHVMVQPHPDGPMAPIGEYVTRAAEQKLVALAGSLRGTGVPVTTSVEIGPIAATVVDKAQRAGADLIVLGTHGRTGLRHLVLGSVAERVVRTSKVPVLVVRHAGADVLPVEEEQARVETEG